jgi:hypothetical protein
MTLVIKSWSVNPDASAGQPHLRVVGRESGIVSFVLSLVGISATTSLIVTSRHIEYERGSLSGFERSITPMSNVSATYYGRFKPWKLALAIATISVPLISFFGLGLIGILSAGLYYYLNKKLTLGFVANSGKSSSLVFKRSVIEGQEITEDALRNIIALIEYLIRPDGTVPTFSAEGGRPASSRMADAAPTSIKQILPQASTGQNCPSCGTAVTADELFCGNCGHRLR